jgi:hypothetical protein
MAPLVFMLLAAAPSPSLAISADLTYANGLAPGNTVGLAAGARFAHRRMSVGLELQFLTPGSHTVESRDVFPNVPRWWGPEGSVSFGSQGLGVVGHVPLCLPFGPLSTCGVASVGAVNLRSYLTHGAGSWHPLVSAGLRLAGELPLESSVRLRASVQILGGIVRPTDGFWSASPVQLGVSLGVVFDAL